MPISSSGLPQPLSSGVRELPASAARPSDASVSPASDLPSAAALISGEAPWCAGAEGVLAQAMVQTPGWPRRYALGVDSGDGRVHDAVPEGGGAKRVVVSRQGEGWTSAVGPWRSTGAPASDFMQAAMDGLEHITRAEGEALYQPPTATDPAPAAPAAGFRRTGLLTQFQIAKSDPFRPRRFERGERLTAPQALVRGESAVRSGGSQPSSRPAEALKGQVAATLGQLLQARYQWSRPVVLEGRAFDRLMAQAAKHPEAALSWQLRVDAQGRRVELALHRDQKPDAFASAPVLDLRRITSGAMLLRLDTADDTGPEHERLSERFNAVSLQKGGLRVPLQQGDALEKQQPLKDLHLRQPLVLVGHGSVENPLPKGHVFRVDHMGNASAKEIAHRLIAQGLDKRYEGTIHLTACHSGSGFNGPGGLADELRTLLADHGYERLSVAGLPGRAWIDEGGHVFANVDAVVSDTPSTIERTRRLVDRLKTARKEASDVARTQGGEVSKGGKAQNEETRLLTRLIRQEQDYLQQLKQINTERRDVNRGKRELNETALEHAKAHGVREWWGVYGPRKATPPAGLTRMAATDKQAPSSPGNPASKPLDRSE